jgi:sodium transport system ATP-binding protein
MVEVKNINKIFKLSKKQMKKDQTQDKIKVAVKDLSFHALKGEIYGLLGPNGAGKTTTLRCISTLIKPSSGQISVMGIDVDKQPRQARKNIAFLTNELKLDDHFTASDTVHYFGELHGMKKEKIEARKNLLFDYFNISDFSDRKISEFSTGMKQKLSIAVSLIHDPQVIIFDEPTNGLDIITARSVTDYLLKLKDQGKVVIVSTHIMSVASKLCDRFGVILEGSFVAEGTLDEILEATGTHDLEEAFFKLYERKAGLING